MRTLSLHTFLVTGAVALALGLTACAQSPRTTGAAAPGTGSGSAGAMGPGAMGTGAMGMGGMGMGTGAAGTAAAVPPTVAAVPPAAAATPRPGSVAAAGAAAGPATVPAAVPATVAAAVPRAAAGNAAAATPGAPGAASPQVANEYRLGAGDVVRITVFQNPELSLETRVTESGLVSYPLLGNVRLGGLTVTAAEKLIADGLRNGNFVRQPQVGIVVAQVRGNQASVLGQVNRPGRYPIEVADLRLTDLLALAGGAAPTGADVVVVTGQRDGKPFRMEVDLPSVFSSAGRDKDIVIQNGDTVWVDRQPMVYIYGEVQRPGPMRLERGMTLMQSLAAGGGLTQRGTEKGIRVHRRNADGSVQVVQPRMEDRMQDGDVVYVRESLF